MPQLIASIEGVEIKKIFLQKDATSLGRRNDNDIVLEDMAVSGRHCVFELKGLADVFVEDLNSTNGTFVNNKKVRRQHLQDGDVLAIGAFRLQFLSASEEPSSVFGETSAMRLEPDGTPARESTMIHASFQVQSGSSAGLEVPVMKAVTTFGKPGVAVVAVSHRRTGFYVACMDATVRPTLNGAPIGYDAVQLSAGDVLELAGTKMKFQIKD
ncbi:MAG: FHA domain-containing protein [Ramlibacter sp.]